MSTQENEQVFQRIREHAFRSLSFEKRQTTNLHLDERIYREGETIGPEFQKIVAPRASILVFADDQPLANFGHSCRYLLYDAKTGEFHREVAAHFPPMADAKQPKTLRPFYEPVQFVANPIRFQLPHPIWRCPIILPHGKRYAILFSGKSANRHLNDLEFCYRVLIDRYAFDPNNIYVLNFDGTLNVDLSQPGTTQPTVFPDGTTYRMHVTGQGTRSAFESAIDDLKTRIKHDDLLLIHTNNHGNYDNVPGSSQICTYPSYAGYYASDFASKLSQLPRFGKLIICMEQCFSGGFNAPVLASNPADAMSIATAVKETDVSWGDGNFDFFARDWISAQAGHDPYGNPLAHNADADGDGKIEAEEAFGYANSVHYSLDSPTYSENSEAGGDVALGQEYRVWWWWCPIWYQVLEPYRVKLPLPEYYTRLHKIQPELAKLTAELDKTSEGLRKEMQARVEALVKEAFKS